MRKSFQVEESIAKSQATIEKKNNTIDRMTKRIEKASIPVMEKYGCIPSVYDVDPEYYNHVRTIESSQRSIESARKAIEKQTALLEKYTEEMKNVLKVERDIPPILHDLKDALVKDWDKWDAEMVSQWDKEIKEIGYHDWRKKHTMHDYDLLHATKEDIHKNNERDAYNMVVDLYLRVQKKVGAITCCDRIRVTSGNGGPVLNGIVEGTQGRVRVESIGAGGYNIQRYHIRVLLKSC